MRARLPAAAILSTAVLLGGAILSGAVVPPAIATHLPAEWECPPNMRHRDTLVLGGQVEYLLGIGPGLMQCHFDMGCPDAGPCQFEVTASASGLGTIEIYLEPFNGIDPVTTCGPQVATCTVTALVNSDGAHEAHLNCAFGTATIAADVEFQCASRLAP